MLEMYRYFEWVNEFKYKKPKCFVFFKVNNLFLPFKSLYKKRLKLFFGVKFLNFDVEIIKPSFLSSVMNLMIESDAIQFVRSGYKVLLLSLKNHFILED